MRIQDAETNRVLTNVLIYLTPEEASELGQAALDLAPNPQKHHHHVPDREFMREITIAVYTPETMSLFDSESRKIMETE